jgi:flagellar biosynthetic protein FliQ
MNEVDALELVRSAIWTVLVAAGPSVGAAMLVGIAVALLQALTQVQEVTLTFVPKIVAILLVMLVTGTFVGSQIYAFARDDLRADRDGVLKPPRRRNADPCRLYRNRLRSSSRRPSPPTLPTGGLSPMSLARAPARSSERPCSGMGDKRRDRTEEAVET